jgi:hypothetical protein
MSWKINLILIIKKCRESVFNKVVNEHFLYSFRINNQVLHYSLILFMCILFSLLPWFPTTLLSHSTIQYLFVLNNMHLEYVIHSSYDEIKWFKFSVAFTFKFWLHSMIERGNCTRFDTRFSSKLCYFYHEIQEEANCSPEQLACLSNLTIFLSRFPTK